MVTGMCDLLGRYCPSWKASYQLVVNQIRLLWQRYCKSELTNHIIGGLVIRAFSHAATAIITALLSPRVTSASV